jgi:hypothetical protein
LKVTFIGHAALLIETRGVRVLSDPWWTGPCFGAQWWAYPDAYTRAVHEGPVDYIYISHGHNDHLHPGTLRTLDRNSTVLISKHTGLAPTINGLGFRLVEIAKDEEAVLRNGVKCRIIPTYYEDTLMVLSGGDRVCLNLNDALHAAPVRVQDSFVSLLRRLYPWIDYVFCGYGTASHFPNCYRVPGADVAATAANRQRHFNQAWARIVAGLRPRYGFPFAADVVFLERDLLELNEPIHNNERPTALFMRNYRKHETEVIDIAPGFIVEDDAVVSRRVRQPVSNEAIKRKWADKVARSNLYRAVGREEIEDVRALLDANVRICQAWLTVFPHDYRCLIRFHGAEEAIEVRKTGAALSARIVALEEVGNRRYELTYTTRLSYLRRSLTTRYGILFVGSGGMFEYLDRTCAELSIHRELMEVMKRHEDPPGPRRNESSRRIRRLRGAVKRVLGVGDRDLYNLGDWLVFGQQRDQTARLIGSGGSGVTPL